MFLQIFVFMPMTQNYIKIDYIEIFGFINLYKFMLQPPNNDLKINTKSSEKYLVLIIKLVYLSLRILMLLGFK